MPDFAYTARDTAGEKITGTLSAATVRDAIALLDSRSLFPVKVEAQQMVRSGRLARRVRPRQVALVYSQLSSLLRSGVPLLRSLEVLRDQTTHAGLKQVLTEVHGRVEEGDTLADAMGRFPKVFNEIARSMIMAGGEGGFLEEALERVAEFTEQQQELVSQTVGALVYPIVLAVFGFGVVTVLLVFFVPSFAEQFARLDQRGQLPDLTKWLLAVSAAVNSWWGLVALVVLAAGGAYLAAMLRTDEGRGWRDRIKLRVPLAGGILRSMAVARFCRVLGTLLHNGVPILRSLEISSRATGNRVLATAITDAAENVTAGESLAGPLAHSGQFPPMVVEMISVAEEANNLEVVLSSIANTLERDTWRRLSLMVRLLEPLILIVMAGVVLLFFIALFLPMIKMTEAY